MTVACQAPLSMWILQARKLKWIALSSSRESSQPRDQTQVSHNDTLFVDAYRVLDQIPKEEFPAQTLAIELYIEAGVRGCEIGYILADRDPVTRENRFGGLDLLRLCIARRVYTNNHMDVIAAALKNVYDRRHEITRGGKIVWETELMRHFTVKLERL